MPTRLNPASLSHRWRFVRGVPFLLHQSERTPEGVEMHSHACHRVSMLLEGSLAEIDERGHGVMTGPLTLHVSPAHRRHGHRLESSFGKSLCFDLPPEMLAELGTAGAGAFERPLTLRAGPTISLVTRFYREFLCEDEASDLALHGLIFELAATLERRRQSPRMSDAPSWLRKARDMIHDSYSGPLRLSDIAHECGIHPSSLTRVFRQFTKMSPGEYLRRVRVEQATRAVLYTDRPLKEIAKAAGFADPAHFSREFRRANGASPSEMRQLRAE